MKVGSLVVFVNHSRNYNDFKMKQPDPSKIYTVIEIQSVGDVVNGFECILAAILLDELRNNQHWIGFDPGYIMEDFREVDTVPDAAIEELLKQPEYATI